MSPLLLSLVVGALALVGTALLTPLVRGAALGAGLVRQVQEDRWHRRPTPAIGGVAIYLGFAFSMALGVTLAPDILDPLGGVRPQALVSLAPWEGLLVAATLAFLLGLVDDFVALSPLAKLGGQLLAALVLLTTGIGVWLTGVYAVDALLSLFWFLAVTNALNLLDNMDGVAAGTAVISALFIAYLLVLEGESGMAITAVALAASAGGFLVHNYPPARIFMGDSGALFLGMLLAGLALAPAEGLSRSLAAVVLIPAAVLALPLLDTTLVTVSRVLEGRRITEGGRDHTAHRLVSLGVAEERAMWVLWGVGTLGGTVALLVRTAERETALLVGALLLVVLGLLGTFMLRVRLRAVEEARGGEVALFRAFTALHGRIPALTLAMDGVLAVAAYYGAYLVRWDAPALPAELVYFRETVTLVVASKLAVFALAGLYQQRWGRYGLADALRTARVSLLGSLAVSAVLLVVAREGLSRGVLLVDAGLCTFLLTASRVSFRVLEGATRSLAQTGRDAVLLGPAADMDLLLRVVDRAPGARGLRPVAGADPDLGARRVPMGRLQVYGGPGALDAALDASGAGAVVLLERGPDDPLPEAVRHHLRRVGGVDVFRVRLAVEQVAAPASPPGGGFRPDGESD